MQQAKLDQWWHSQFRRLLVAEERGLDPKALESRWLLLASLTWGSRARTVSFDVPLKIYHVLDDADVRAKDARYAAGQRKIAWEYLNA